MECGSYAHINSQEHLTVPPRGNYPGGSPMAAKAAQFLAVTDKLIAPDKMYR